MVDLTPLWLSMKVACCATIAIFPGGVLVAWWLSHGPRFRGKVLFEAFFSLPLVLPPTVTGFYLLEVFGRGTSVGRWMNDVLGIRLIFTWEGATLAAAVMAFPLFVRTATAAFGSIEENLLEAGRTLGAGEFALLVRIVVPECYRGVLAGLTLGFARALGEFGATLMIAGSIPGRTQTLPLALYDAVEGGANTAAIVYTAILSMTAFAVLGGAGIYQGALARKRGEKA
jgi:molybdate transport system permease protein